MHMNGTSVGSLSTRRGLLQGGILSPLLFSLFIDDLADALAAHGRPLLFADDVALKCRSPTEAQAMLDICHAWASQNRLSWTIMKCGVVSQKAIPSLLLGSQTVPLVDSYKYLGVPHSASRVEWDSLLRSNIQKVENWLQALSDTAQAWPPNTRLTIWKTFIRPRLEYCLPLAVLWCKKQRALKKPVGAALMASLDKVYSDGLSFTACFPRKSGLLGRLSGTGTLELRLDILLAGLAWHLRHLSQSNPCSTLSNKLSSSAHHIAPSCFTHQLIGRFSSRAPATPGSTSRRAFGAYLREYRISSLGEPYFGKLDEYVTLVPGGAPDPAYFLKDSSGTRWRLGSWGQGFKCPLCNESWNRAHIERCHLLHGCPEAHAILASDAFFASRDELESKSRTPDKFYFTPLDYALNVNNLDAFRAMSSFLRKKLVAHLHPS